MTVTVKHVQHENKCTHTVYTAAALLNIQKKLLSDRYKHTHINPINSVCEALSVSTHTHTPMKIIDVLSYKTVAAP